MKKAFVLLLFLPFLGGCGNPYSKFYTDFTGGKNVLENPDVIISTDEPKLIQGSNIEEEDKGMMKDGYLLLGISGFQSSEIDQNAALKQAKKIHADTVIVYCAYAGTVSGIMPMTTPNTQTSYQSGTVYGSGGGFANYSGTSTTYGSTTTYMPYSIRRYDYYASFWIKAKLPALGVYFDNLTDELCKKISSNKGTYVVVVVKGSPAFLNDILAGDIIRKINDVEVIDAVHAKNIMYENRGQEIKLEIFRDGKTIMKQIHLN